MSDLAMIGMPCMDLNGQNFMAREAVLSETALIQSTRYRTGRVDAEIWSLDHRNNKTIPVEPLYPIISPACTAYVSELWNW